MQWINAKNVVFVLYGTFVGIDVHHSKANVPTSNTVLNNLDTDIEQQYVVRCGFKN